MAFDLAQLLRDNVSSLDTGRERIEYVALDKISGDAGNFYALGGIEELADNIALCGLQQPIRLRPDPAGEGQYIIVSGHRRTAALRLLYQEEGEKWQEVPCIIERDAASPAMRQLRLIFANLNTRKMTSAELAEEADQVEKLLVQLKGEGYDFPGRIRERVAEAMNVSSSKLARLKVIRDDLAACWRPAYQAGDLCETVAYALAKLRPGWQDRIFSAYGEAPKGLTEGAVRLYAARFQAIEKIECRQGYNDCRNTAQMEARALKKNSWEYSCDQCCFDCSLLTSCAQSCELAEEKKRSLKQEAKDARLQQKAQEAERDAPKIAYIRGVYARVKVAREAAGKSVLQVLAAGKNFISSGTEAEHRQREDGKVTAETNLPFGNTFLRSNAESLVAVADLLGVTTDYLLGRTETMQPTAPDRTEETRPAVQPSGGIWHPAEELPEARGTYLGLFRIKAGYTLDLHPRDAFFDGEEWFLLGVSLSETASELVCWTEFPEV